MAMTPAIVEFIAFLLFIVLLALAAMSPAAIVTLWDNWSHKRVSNRKD